MQGSADLGEICRAMAVLALSGLNFALHMQREYAFSSLLAMLGKLTQQAFILSSFSTTAQSQDSLQAVLKLLRNAASAGFVSDLTTAANIQQILWLLEAPAAAEQITDKVCSF